MAERELNEPNRGDRRFVRRDDQGRFEEVVDAGRSSAQDQRREADKPAREGHGDTGDRES